MQFQKLLIKISKKLIKHKISYMIIGGQAVLLYGEPRLTKDIDITISLDTSKYHILEKVIKQLKFEIIPENPKEFVETTFVLPTIDPKTTIRIDFIFSISEYEKQAFKRVRKININNTPINYASLEDLIIHKIIAGRQRDIEDIKYILLKNKEIDNNYINFWLLEFEKLTQKELRQVFESIKKDVFS